MSASMRAFQLPMKCSREDLQVIADRNAHTIEKYGRAYDLT
jgi:hypothetical protein